MDKKFVFVVDKDGLRSRQIAVAMELPQVYVIETGLTEPATRSFWKVCAKTATGHHALNRPRTSSHASKFPPASTGFPANLAAQSVARKVLMFARFIHRPVLAIVTSLILVFMGLLAMRTLPVSQFPEISPPRVIVTIDFPAPAPTSWCSRR